MQSRDRNSEPMLLRFRLNFRLLFFLLSVWLQNALPVDAIDTADFEESEKEALAPLKKTTQTRTPPAKRRKLKTLPEEAPNAEEEKGEEPVTRFKHCSVRVKIPENSPIGTFVTRLEILNRQRVKVNINSTQSCTKIEGHSSESAGSRWNVCIGLEDGRFESEWQLASGQGDVQHSRGRGSDRWDLSQCFVRQSSNQGRSSGLEW